MTKYSDIEIQTAKRLHDAGYKWLARTMVGNVVAFSYKPYKSEGLWLCPINSACISGEVVFVSGKFTPFFQSIKWEDKEPTSLEDIVHPQILDDAEKRYLKGVIRPFRSDVYSIEKAEHSQCEMICIGTKNRYMVFPPFEKGTMYKGMETGRKYTLEELGL